MIFGADCNEFSKMGNILGFGFSIGGEIGVGGEDEGPFDTGMSCGFVRAQTILKNVQNNDGTYTGNFHGIWEEENTQCEKHKPKLNETALAACKLDVDLEACDKDYRKEDEIQWCKEHVEKVHNGVEAEMLDTCARPENTKAMTDIGIEMGKSMANAACAINNARMRFNDGAQKCAAIYGCQAMKCVEGYAEWGIDAKDRMVDCVDDYAKACDPTDFRLGDYKEPPNTYPPDNENGSTNLPEDKRDCQKITCDCNALMEFFGTDDFPRLAGAAAKCLEDTVFGNPKHRELIAWVVETPQVLTAAADWAGKKLADLHQGAINFVGEAMEVVEGVFTGETTPAQLAEIGIDVIKGIPEIAEAIPDIDWVLNNFINTGDICHNIKQIVTDPGAVLDSIADAAGDLADSALDGIGDLGDAALEGLGDLGDAALDGLGDLGDAALQGLGDASDSVVSGLGDLGDATLQGLGDVSDSVVSGLGDLGDTALQGLGDVTDSVLDGVEDVAGRL